MMPRHEKQGTRLRFSRKHLLLAGCILLVLQAVSGARVGVYPGTDYLGTVERGETVSTDFLLVGGSPGDTVTLQYLEPQLSDFEERNRPYPFSSANASQERIKNWVELTDDTVTLQDPSTMQIQGRRVEGNGRVTYLVHVPEDAEPGYHVGTFIPKITESGSGDGMGVGTNAVSRYKFVFKVPGHAVRDASILGFNGERVGEYAEEVDVVVQNTGTVTATIGVDPRVYYNNGTKTLVHRSTRLSPDGIGTVTSRWNFDEDVSTGRYNVGGSASWLTGSTDRNGTITVTGYTPVSTTTSSQPDDTGNDVLISGLTILLVLIIGWEVWKQRRE